MYEVSGNALFKINVSVVGYCGCTNSARVGKSCLINSFMNREEYTEDHLSVISNSDYNGSIIASSQWIYWGSRTVKYNSINFSIRIIEQCDFIDDHLFTQFDKSSYLDRCFSSCVHVEEPKVAYICKEHLGTEWKYPREVLESGDFHVHAFVVVSDITLTGKAAYLQQRFLTQGIYELKKQKLPFVLVTSKHDGLISSLNQNFIKDLIHKHNKSLHKIKFCQIETSARLGLNVDDVFLSAALLTSSAQNDLNGKYYPCYIPKSTPFLLQNINRVKPSKHRNILSSYYADISIMPPQIMPPENCHALQIPARCGGLRGAERSSDKDLIYDLPIEEYSFPGSACNIQCFHTPLDSSTPESMRLNSNASRLVPTSLTIGVSSSIYNKNLLYETIIDAQSTALPTEITNSANAPLLSPVSAAPIPSSVTQVIHYHHHIFRSPTVSSEPLPPSSFQPPLLILFLLGPRASALNACLQAQGCLAQFKTVDGHSYRLLIFNAGDPLHMKIDPSKWRSPNVLRHSPSAPSAFSALTSTLPIIDDSPSSSSTEGIQQFRLTLWVEGKGYISSSPESSSRSLDAVVHFDSSCFDDITQSPAFTLANNLRIPVFRVYESSTSQFLTHLLFYAAIAKAIIPCSPSLLFHPHPTPISVLGGLCGGLSPLLMDDSRQPSTVAIGVEFIHKSGYSLESQHSRSSPLVVYTNFAQALELLTRYVQINSAAPTWIKVRFCFVALHFLDHLWPHIKVEVTSQLEALFAAASDCCSRQNDPVERSGNLESLASADNPTNHLILLLVSLSLMPPINVQHQSIGTIEGRRLVNGMAAQQGCLLWHPNVTLGNNFPIYSAVQEPLEKTWENGSSTKPSLTFLNIGSEKDKEYERYQQILNADMSDWLQSFSPQFRPSSNTQNGRCSGGDACDECSRHCQKNGHGLLQQNVLCSSVEEKNLGGWVDGCLIHSRGSMHCCAAARFGLLHNEYVDGSIRFDDVPSDTDGWISHTQQPQHVDKNKPTNLCSERHDHPRTAHLLRQSTEDRLSEHYAEFPDLDAVVETGPRMVRPKRPQAPISRCSSMGSLTMSSASPECSASSTPPTSFAHPCNDSGVVLLGRRQITNPRVVLASLVGSPRGVPGAQTTTTESLSELSECVVSSDNNSSPMVQLRHRSSCADVETARRRRQIHAGSGLTRFPSLPGNHCFALSNGEEDHIYEEPLDDGSRNGPPQMPQLVYSSSRSSLSSSFWLKSSGSSEQKSGRLPGWISGAGLFQSPSNSSANTAGQSLQPLLPQPTMKARLKQQQPTRGRSSSSSGRGKKTPLSRVHPLARLCSPISMLSFGGSSSSTKPNSPTGCKSPTISLYRKFKPQPVDTRRKASTSQVSSSSPQPTTSPCSEPPPHLNSLSPSQPVQPATADESPSTNPVPSASTFSWKSAFRRRGSLFRPVSRRRKSKTTAS